MDDRKLTLIVIPHGGLETRSLEISYSRLRFFVYTGIAMVIVVGVLLASWFPVAAQASRTRALERQLAGFERERAAVAELARQLEDVEEQYERVRQLLGADGPSGGAEPLLPPLRRPDAAESGEAGEVQTSGILDSWPLATAGFITRTIGTGAATHPGLDIAVPRNTYVRAAGAGTVRHAGDDPIYGLHVVIDHGSGVETLYGHASRLLVRTGDRVTSRQFIALSGSTGQSTAPHLHFEVRRGGTPVDPLLFVRQP
jgi:murein DD-endopeptidase MepM/ murein hydrolase activator NlpD